MTPSPGLREKGDALRLLILGGTTEASGLARVLAERTDVAPLLSFAGRTERPAAPPIPYRIGGFGGVAGLTRFLRDEAIGAVVDATHPFAARISANADAACRAAGVPLVGYTRPTWETGPDDRWVSVADVNEAVFMLRDLTTERLSTSSLPGAQAAKQSSPSLLDCFAPPAMAARNKYRTTEGPPEEAGSVAARRPSTRALRARLKMMGWKGGPLTIFLTTGRLDIALFRAAPHHRYLVRTIDSPDAADLPPDATVVRARPPFTAEDEVALMRAHGIDLLVTKNSGGTASASKLMAARALGLPVLMIERPPSSGTFELQEVDAVLAWISKQPAA